MLNCSGRTESYLWVKSLPAPWTLTEIQFEKYLVQLSSILLQLSQHSKLFTRHMTYEDFKQMDWDVGSLRHLQRVLHPNVENKILSILDYLYDGTSLHFKMKKNNNKNNIYKKMTSTNNNKTKRRRGRTLRRTTRRNSIA